MSKKKQPKESLKRLGRLRLRDTSAAAAASRQYSKLVDRLRWILPLVILVGLGLLITWPTWQTNQISAVMVENVPNLMIEKLNLTGLDVNNQPYALTADRALQAVNTKNLVDLEKPKGEITLQGGAWMAVHADQGRLDQESKKLWLGGHVEIFHDAGHRFASSEMNADLAKSTAWGTQPVEIQSTFGTIAGGGFRILDGGKVIVVTGPAKARLDLRSLSDSDKPNLNHSEAR